MGKRWRTARSRVSATLRSWISIAGWSSCEPTTSARSSTTGRAGSGRTRSSGATRRSRSARRSRWPTRTGSSRRTASRRSGSCAGCRPRRCSPGGAAIRPAGGTRASTGSRRSRSRSRRTSRTRSATPGARSSRARSDCAIAYFGDGATSEGAFHEGANFAAVMRAPAVLLCNNNQWAISTPLSAQTRAEALADKAVGYGMPGVRVDGGDVLAVYEATAEALARARAGEGPTFIEALTYRAAPHATADDPSAYWDEERVEEERRNECLGRFERYLRRRRRPRPTRSPRSQGGRARAHEGGHRGRRGAAAARSARSSSPHALRRPRRPEAPRWLSGRSSRRSTTALHGEMERDDAVMVLGEDVGRPAASSARRPGCATASAPTAASTRRSPRRGSSARRSAWRWPAGGRSARCSTSPSATPASTS